MKLHAAFVTIVFTVFVPFAAHASGANAAASGGTSSSPIKKSRTVTYCKRDNLKMQVHGQRKGAQEQAAILYIHGGGWNSGDRKSGFERRRMKPLKKAGFVVATIDYRLAPENTHPAQIHDAKCAVKYLRANSERLGIHPGRIGVMGDSAGGHLAAMIGLTDNSHELEGDSFPGVSSRVKAVATFYGIFDLVNVEPSLAQQAIPPAFPSDEAREQGSPIRYVSSEDPPFLIVHGKKDRFVHVGQSVTLARSLKLAGQKPLLMAVENADHGFVKSGGTPTPDNETIDKLMVAFFFEHLKP